MDVGGFVERSGIAVVHKGEGVLNEKMMNTGGHSYHFAPNSIVVQTSTVGNVDRDGVVKMVKKVIRDGGF